MAPITTQHQARITCMFSCKIQHFSRHLPHTQTYFALHFLIMCQDVPEKNLNPHMILSTKRHFSSSFSLLALSSFLDFSQTEESICIGDLWGLSGKNIKNKTAIGDGKQCNCLDNIFESFFPAASLMVFQQQQKKGIPFSRQSIHGSLSSSGRFN